MAKTNTGRSSSFRTMIDQFSSSLPSQAFDHLKHHCNIMGVMTHDHLEGMTTTSYLLGWLSTKRLLNPDNLQLLEYVATQARKEKLVEMISDFAVTRSPDIAVDAAGIEYPQLDVLNYSSVAFTLPSDSDQWKRSEVNSLCQTLCQAVDISHHEMVWEGLKKGCQAGTIVLMTLMPVKALVHIREMSQTTKNQLKIIDIEIFGFNASSFDGILHEIRRGNSISIHTKDGMSPQLVHKFFREAAKSDNVKALETLVNVQESLNIGVDFRGAIQSAAKAGSSSTFRYLVSKGAPVGVQTLYDAYLHGHAELVRELREQDISLHPNFHSCEGLLTEVSRRRKYPASLFESLLSSLPDAGDNSDFNGFMYEKAVVNSCRNGRHDLVALLIRKGAEVRSLPEDCFRCFGQGLANIRCKSRHVYLRERLPISGCEVDWTKCGLFLLDGRWFERIEKDRNVRLMKVDVSGNHLKSVPLNLLDGTFPLLEEFLCSENEITNLGNNEMFDVANAPQLRLKSIDVSHNKLESLPLYLFQIESLETLNVCHNSLETLPPEKRGSTTGEDERVWRCTRLSVLDISHNCITKLPNWFGDALNLRRLKAARNRLITLPKSFLKMKFLEYLDLSGNNLGLTAKEKKELSFIPKSVTNLTVRENALLSLPIAFIQISSLKRLDCSRNQISSLPDANSWNAPFLETLNLSKNQLHTVDFPLSLRTSLCRLNLNSNGLDGFPDSILKLSFLASLDLTGNPNVTRYPDKLATMKRLWDVSLDDSVGAALAIDPNLSISSGNFVHFSRIRNKMRESFYKVDYFNGVKMTVIGNKSYREQILKRLHEKSATTARIPGVNEGQLVTSLVLSERSENSPVQPRKRTFSLRGADHGSIEDATFKVWEITDDESFLALQHAFFNENVVHLVLWSEADGSYGVDDVEKWLQLIQAKCRTVRVLVACLDNRAQGSQNQDRIRRLIQSPNYNQWCRCIAVEQTLRMGRNVFSLPSELVKEAFTLARIQDDQFKGLENKVPLDYRTIALELMKSNSSMAFVCRRRYLNWIVDLEKKMEKDEDDFARTMHFLTRIGALIHYNDTPGNLYQYYFTNLSGLTQIITALAVPGGDGNRQAIQSGFISKATLQYLLATRKVVQPDEVDACASLLTKLQIVVPVDEDYYLLPFRLPKDRPGLNLSFSQFLSSGTDKELPCVRRIYSTNLVPRAFWGQLIGILVQDMSRLLSAFTSSGGVVEDYAQIVNPHSVYWRDGLVVFYAAGCLVVEAIVPDGDGGGGDEDEVDDEKVAENRSRSRKLSVEAKGKRCGAQWGIDISVFDNFRRFATLGVVCDHVEELLNQHRLDVVARLVPYPPFCIEKGCRKSDFLLNDFIAKHLIPVDARLYQLEECAWAVNEEKSLKVGYRHAYPLDIAQLAPDLVMSDLPDRFLLDHDKLEIDVSSYKELGRGGYGHVFVGVYDLERVAVKVFERVNFEDLFHTDVRPSPTVRRKGTAKRMLSWGQFRAEAGPRKRTEAIRKRPRPPNDYLKKLNSFRREVMIFQRLQHPNVILFKGVLFHPYPSIVMEIAPGGDLETLVDERWRKLTGAIDEDRNAETEFQTMIHHGVLGRRLTHRIAYQIALGLEYLHGQSICYLDLKPQNVLVWSDSLTAPVNVKLSDYGISLTSRPEVGVKASCGTVGYQAPEQILCIREFGETFDARVDIYSYGTVLYKVLTGSHPFDSGNVMSSVVEFKIRHNQLPTLPNGQSLVHLQDVIRRCWKYWPNERPSASQIVAEMSEPSFHLCCKDLSVVGRHKILSSTVISNDELFDDDDFEEEDKKTVPTPEKVPGSGDQRHRILLRSRCLSMDVRLLAQRRLRRRSHSFGASSRSPIVSRPRTVPRVLSVQEWTDRTKRKMQARHSIATVSESPSLTRSVMSTYENTKERILGSPSPTSPPSFPSIADIMPEEAASGDDEDDNLYISKPFAFSLLVTSSESLLVSDPFFSFFVSDQKVSSHLAVEKVTAVLWLRGRLWVGLCTGEIFVFECGEGVMTRKLDELTFKSDSSVVDLKSQTAKAGKEAKVFALLADGEMVTFHGRESSDGRSSAWIRDSGWTWAPPRRLQVTANDGDVSEMSTPAVLLPVLPGEVWHVSGDSIVVIDTDGSMEAIVIIEGSDPNGKVSVEEAKCIRECAIVGDVVWMYDGMAKEWLIKVDIVTRKVLGRWSIKDLLHLFSGSSAAVSVPGREVIQESLRQHRLTTISCICAVNNDLWVGCDGGAIIILKVGEEGDTPSVVCVLWCRSVFNHATGRSSKLDCPFVTISELQQVKDRVLVFQSDHKHAYGEGSDAVCTVAEVYEARSVDELEECMHYYNVSRSN